MNRSSLYCCVFVLANSYIAVSLTYIEPFPPFIAGKPQEDNIWRLFVLLSLTSEGEDTEGKKNLIFRNQIIVSGTVYCSFVKCIFSAPTEGDFFY